MIKPWHSHAHTHTHAAKHRDQRFHSNNAQSLWLITRLTVPSNHTAVSCSMCACVSDVNATFALIHIISYDSTFFRLYVSHFVSILRFYTVYSAFLFDYRPCYAMLCIHTTTTVCVYTTAKTHREQEWNGKNKRAVFTNGKHVNGKKDNNSIKSAFLSLSVGHGLEYVHTRGVQIHTAPTRDILVIQPRTVFLAIFRILSLSLCVYNSGWK